LIRSPLVRSLWYGLILGLVYFVLEARLGESFAYRVF